MLAQVTAAALTSELKTLCHPASADTIPTSANKEDHVSMSMGAALKAERALQLARQVLAVEMLCACQAIDLRAPLTSTPALMGAHGAVRAVVPTLHDDRAPSSRHRRDYATVVERRARVRDGRACQLNSSRIFSLTSRPPVLSFLSSVLALPTCPPQMTTVARTIRAPRGTSLTCQGWPQEAALRMLMNNLDPDVAERPDDLVVYGGTGKAARSWAAFDAIVAALRALGSDETLLVQSGKPVARVPHLPPRAARARSPTPTSCRTGPPGTRSAISRTRA